MNLPYIDILSPIDELLARAQYGRMHRFTFCPTSEFNAFRVEKLLRRYGVRVWGRKIVDGSMRSFVVKERQAVWAEYVMCRAGIPLVDELIDPRNAQYPERHPEASMCVVGARRHGAHVPYYSGDLFCWLAISHNEIFKGDLFMSQGFVALRCVCPLACTMKYSTAEGNSC